MELNNRLGFLWAFSFYRLAGAKMFSTPRFLPSRDRYDRYYCYRLLPSHYHIHIARSSFHAGSARCHFDFFAIPPSVFLQAIVERHQCGSSDAFLAYWT